MVIVVLNLFKQLTVIGYSKYPLRKINCILGIYLYRSVVTTS